MNLEPRVLRWLAALAILVATFVVHAPSIDNDFVFDDRSNVKALDDRTGRAQEMVATLQPLSVYFTSHYLRGVAGTSRGYRPITVLSYALTFHLLCGGRIEDDSPRPHHVLNVLLQVCNTLLVLMLLARLCPGWPGFAGALVFGVHSIHSESVAGIVGRGELLGFAFGLTSLLLFLRGSERDGARRWAYLVGASASQFLAFCSKESSLAWAAFLPVVVIAQNLMSPNPRLRRDLWSAAIIGAVPAAAFLVMYAVVILALPEYHTSYLTNPLCYASARTRVFTSVVVWAFAVYQCLLPFRLCCDYGADVFTLVKSAGDYRLWLSCSVLLFLLLGGFRVARRHPHLFLAMACFFGFSFIVSNFAFAQETIYGERTYYAPSLAASFVVAWSWNLAKSRRGRLLTRALVLAWTAACGFVDVQRMRDWSDNDTLFLHDMQVQPRSLRLLDTAADAYFGRGQPAKGLEMYRRLLDIEPEYPKALLLLGNDLMRRGRMAEAEAMFRRCQRSRLLPRIERVNIESRLYMSIGNLLKARGRVAQSLRMYERSLQVDPAFLKARFLVARARIDTGDLAAALALIAEGEQHDPRHPCWRLQRGKIAWRQGRPADAEKLLGSALRELDMSFQTLDDWLDLVAAQNAQGRHAEAMRTLDHALEMGNNEIPAANRERVERLRRGG